MKYALYESINQKNILSSIIEISIKNNGKGISPELLEKSKATLPDSENPESDHVGLKNVNLLIKLLFGSNYGITDIESGTVVKIIIPLMYGEH